MRQLLFSFLFLPIAFATAQSANPDTVRLSISEFLERGVEASAEMDARYQNVEQAENRYRRTQNQRYLPEISLTTAHGMVPGVESPSDTPRDQLYLDPDIRNDWENWAVFTQGEINIVQPILTWGGISNAIEAARSGAEAVRYEYRAGEEEYKLQLFELYQSRLLAIELRRLLEDARNTLEEAEEQLEELRQQDDPDFTEADIYKFRIFKQRFFTQEQEVLQNLQFVEDAWRLALDADGDRTYVPEEQFLDPINAPIEDIDYYRHLATAERPEVKGLDAAVDAAHAGVEASKARRYPTLILGIQGRAAYTPNRPRQRNPFIRNNTNYLSTSIGVGFRQNLNFRSVNLDIERQEVQRRQAEYQREAAKDGIEFEIREVYRDLQIADSRVENTREALNISNQWLRDEQIDYDLGFGDVENLVDAVRENLELEVEYRRSVHRFNMRLGTLYRKSGLPLSEL